MANLFFSNRAALGRAVVAATVLTLTACRGSSRPEPRLASPAGADRPAAATQEIADDKLLPLAQRRHVWNVEHVAFVLEQKVFPTLAAALADFQVAALRDFLADDFQAHIPEGREQVHQRSGMLSVHRYELPDESTEGADAEAFLEWLAGQRPQCGSAADGCRASIGLVRLGPHDPADMQGPWHSVWRVRMAGRAEGCLSEVVMTLALDLETLDDSIDQRRGWIRSARLEKLQRASAPATLFEETTAASGLQVDALHDNWRQPQAFKANTGGVFLSDYNQDGRLDVLVEDVAAGSILYRGRGDGTFVDATDQAGLTRLDEGRPPLWTASCWADLDGDGDEDLIQQDRLWENLGDGTFRDVTDRSNLLLAPTGGYAVADYDLDGRVDLYVCHSDKYMVGQKTSPRVAWIDGALGIDNVLWRNLGNWQFEDVTAQTGTGGRGSSCFAAIWLDANDDLRPDLLAINEFGRNSLLINRADGTFAESDVDPVFGGFSMGVTAGDFDNDGQSDIYVANMYSKAGNRILANVDPQQYPAEMLVKVREATTGNKLYRSRGDGTFEVCHSSDELAQVGWAYGPNFVDFDGDGLLDVYATAGFKSVQRGKPDG